MSNVDIQWWVQEFVNDPKTRVFATTAGLGSGKTHGLVQCNYHLTCTNKESRFNCFMMPTYQRIHDTAIPTFQKVLQSFNCVEGKHYKIIKSPYPKIIWPTLDKETHFVSATRPDMLVGVEYGSGFISEAGSISEDAFKLLRTRVRDNRAVRRQIVMEGVTQGMNNYYANTFNFDRENGWVQFRDRDYVNPQRLFRRFRLTTYDNQKYLPDDYIEILLDTYRGQHNYIRAWIYGFFTPLVEGNAYTNYNPVLHDLKQGVKLSPFRTVDLTFDFNANPMSWVAVQPVVFEEAGHRITRSVAVREISKEIGQLDDAVLDFAYKFPVEHFANTEIRIFGDSSGHGSTHRSEQSDYQFIVSYLRELGYNNVTIEAIKFNPAEPVSVEALNRKFLNDELYLDPSVTQLKQSLLATRWRDGIRKLFKPPGEKDTHLSDALKYWAFVLNEISGKVIRSTTV